MKSKMCYFIFSGYYKVASASDLLQKNSIPNRIVKAPVHMKHSCNFAVLISADDAGTSMKLLRKDGNLPEKTEFK